MIISLGTVLSVHAPRCDCRTRTICRQRTQILHFLHAVDRESSWVALYGHFLLVHVDYMFQFWDIGKHILDKQEHKQGVKMLSQVYCSETADVSMTAASL